METINNKSGKLFATMLFLFGSIGIVTVIAFDEVYWQTGMFAEGRPDFNPGHIVRSLLIFISVIALFWSLVGNNRPTFKLDERGGLPLERLSILGILSAAVLFLSLFVLKPSAFMPYPWKMAP